MPFSRFAYRAALTAATTVAAVAVARASHSAWSYRAMKPLQSSVPSVTASDHVTIVVPARDEEAVLDACLDGLRRQTHRRLNIVVVDDGSTDATVRIAGRHAAVDERVRVVEAAPLPPGWSGKVHAMYCGVQAAAEDGGLGDWLLFVDADTRARPELVARMLSTSRSRELDLTSTPGGPPEEPSATWWWLMPAGAQLIAENAAPGGRRRKALAIGHCLLIRRATYEKVGGWSTLASARPEDLALASTVRGVGGTTALASGTDEVSTSGVDPFSAGWASFRKSMVTGTRSNLPLLISGGIAHLGFGLIPPAAVVAGLRRGRGGLLLAGTVGWAAQSTGHLLGAKRMCSPPASAALAPFSWALVGGVLLDAARKARVKAVSWKGRTISS